MGYLVSHIKCCLFDDMRRSFATNEFYHIFDRGVDKRKIFLDKTDYLRFIHDLYEFNDINPAPEFSRRYSKNVGNEVSHIERKGRDILVKIHAFVLMPNHHHLLVEQMKDKGVSLFMRKLHGGYSRAFNLRHKRKGHLFQAPFKSVHVEDDIHLGFLICYLHSNSLDIWKKNWKKEKLSDSEIKKALEFLKKYRWSSHLDYLGIKNFPSVINKEFLLEFFDGTEGYREFFIDWLKQYKKNIRYIKNLIFS